LQLDDGAEMLALLTQDWQSTTQALNVLLENRP